MRSRLLRMLAALALVFAGVLGFCCCFDVGPFTIYWTRLFTEKGEPVSAGKLTGHFEATAYRGCWGVNRQEARQRLDKFVVSGVVCIHDMPRCRVELAEASGFADGDTVSAPLFLITEAELDTGTCCLRWSAPAARIPNHIQRVRITVALRLTSEQGGTPVLERIEFRMRRVESWFPFIKTM